METKAAIYIAVIAVVVVTVINLIFFYIPINDIQTKVDAATKKIDTFIASGERIEKKVDGVIEIGECLFASIEGPLYCRFFPQNCTNGQPNLPDICPSTDPSLIG